MIQEVDDRGEFRFDLLRRHSYELLVRAPDSPEILARRGPIHPGDDPVLFSGVVPIPSQGTAAPEPPGVGHLVVHCIGPDGYQLFIKGEGRRFATSPTSTAAGFEHHGRIVRTVEGLPEGRYQLILNGGGSSSRTVTIRAGETTSVEMPIREGRMVDLFAFAERDLTSDEELTIEVHLRDGTSFEVPRVNPYCVFTDLIYAQRFGVPYDAEAVTVESTWGLHGRFELSELQGKIAKMDLDQL